ncbi:phosphodiesterase/alkaline phosphatase D-like protein [Planomicrobium soli]|uniref:Phosphodiesterase/alkaline phosphatase D-like protein n=1 Tax=Planomicrobium soli TaxID=1176648 RepID=A0A2P8H5E3_9BACL|nr:alkaline phosphatase D family protein [Planomicrobium soli]PSL41447.1 phosphodiesterase/alkaline phosphatase D-like protein [Planomicrobium soli]
MNEEGLDSETSKNSYRFSEDFLAGDLFIIDGLSRNIEPYKAINNVGDGFPQSVASGDPTSSGMIIWTRVDPDIESGFSNEEIEEKGTTLFVKSAIKQGKFIEFQVSTNNEFSRIDLSGFAPIWQDCDNVVRIDLNNFLLPDQTYYYRFITKSGFVSRTGRCKTLADKGYRPASIGYISCQDYKNGYFNVLSCLAEEELDFFLHLGDYVYESLKREPHHVRELAVPGGTHKAFTLADYRELYKIYRSDPDLQKLHENHAIVAVWDDHEFADNTYYPAVAPDHSFKPDRKRRHAASQAWLEYMPSRVTYDPGLSPDDALKIYRTLTIGDLATIYMTDERLFRSAPMGGPKQLNEADEKEERSMLGKEQRDWFLNELSESKSLWNIWGNSVQITPFKIRERDLNLDAWDGFTAERDMIAKKIASENIQNFIALTGDFHTFEASYLQTDYSSQDKASKFGVELMVGSVTSLNPHEHIQHPTQKFLGRLKNASGSVPVAPAVELVSEIAPDKGQENKNVRNITFRTLEKIMKRYNPWIKLLDGTSHGYAVLELYNTKAIWKAYGIKTIETHSTEKSLLFQCEIPNGKVEINIIYSRGIKKEVTELSFFISTIGALLFILRKLDKGANKDRPATKAATSDYKDTQSP